jgi:ABC-type uncharacterized transport system involved in gliding motility auxiliary subunit
MAKQNKKSAKTGLNLTAALWAISGVLVFLLLCVRVIFPELFALTIVLAVGLLGSLGALMFQNQKALRSRSAAYGLNSFVTILLVIAIVGVLDFLTSRYPLKWDLTQNKVHTLSEQTVKLVKSLKNPVKATLFAKIQQREQFRPLLDNYKNLNPKFEVEYVDPDREPTRAKQMGIKKYGTLLLTVGNRENKIEDANEEKLTNSLIKLLKDKVPTLCVTTGHGEKNFTAQDQEGFSAVKKSLEDQSYQVRELSLLQETKVPDSCDAIAIMGPTKAFFEAEAKAIRNYLNEGGRAIIAIDLNIKSGQEYSPELLPILAEWHVKPATALVIDPLSRMLGVDASVAVIATFSKENAITKDFSGNCLFPFTRPLDILPGSPTGLNVHWIAQTTPKSWGVTNLKELATGQVRFEAGKDLVGPLNAVVAVEGKQKDSKATKDSRLVVIGSSFFATNNFEKFANNSDFFLNSVAWIVEDESLISIRTKDQTPGKIELSQKVGNAIALLTIIIIPVFIAIAGLVIWLRRRKL